MPVEGFVHPLSVTGRPNFEFSTRDITKDGILLIIFRFLFQSSVSSESGKRIVTRLPQSTIVPASMQGLDGIDFPWRQRQFCRTAVYNPITPNYPRLSDGIGYVSLSFPQQSAIFYFIF